MTENNSSPLELAVLAGRILLSNGAEIFRVQETETVDLGGFELTVHPIKLNIGPLDYTA